MLIEFTVGNYRSFNSLQTISFRAAGLVSEDKNLDAQNLTTTNSGKLIKTIGVYGANASGKSNLIRSLAFFQRLISSSLDAKISTSLIQPFKLKKNSDNAGYFQVVLFISGNRYRYGVTISQVGEIASEWLFGPADLNETYYFKRSFKEISINQERFKEGLNIPYEDKLRSDALFLSFCSAYNGEISNLIQDYFSKNVSMDAGNSLRGLNRNTILRKDGSVVGGSSSRTDHLIEKGQKDIVLNWMTDAGIYYSDVNLKIFELDENFNRRAVVFTKNAYDDAGNITGSVEMDLFQEESEGTQKFYSYIGQLEQKFREGGIFICDEIDANFHPSLLQKLIRLFNNTNINKANAQLLFTSHDTNLMSPDIMRRDQFYFTEKTSTEETRIYSLADLKGIRNNADFAKQYLAGFYGALPVLGDLIEKSEEPGKSND